MREREKERKKKNPQSVCSTISGQAIIHLLKDQLKRAVGLSAKQNRIG